MTSDFLAANILRKVRSVNLTLVFSACPLGWIDGRPTNGSNNANVNKCYILLTDEYRTWDASNARCTEKNPSATLTSIGSSEENDFIKDLCANEGIRWPWLGGNKIGGVWRWENLRITRADRVFASQSLIVEG